MVLRTEAIKNFLAMASSPLARLYNKSMEVQVNVAMDDGARVRNKDFRSPVYTDGIETWKSFRIPYNADSDPVYNDKDMEYNLSQHAEGIGMTGWDWEFKCTRWIGFDFDSITNHKAGLSQDEMQIVLASAMSIPYANIYKSTSGKGYHIYIFFEQPFKSNNHTEHAAVARAMLNVLSVDAGFDFASSVDCMGGVLWVWHRKTGNSDGLSLVKQGILCPINKIPINWRSHLNVVKKKAKRVSIENKDIESLATSLNMIQLEEPHRKIMLWLSQNARFNWWFDSDIQMLVCHTLDLKECHLALKLEGLFETNSSGSSDQNCFCFPIRGGGFIVRRYSKGVQEHECWELDDNGWTSTELNVKANFVRSVNYRKGLLDSKGFYHFPDGATINLMFEDLNIGYRVPESMMREYFKVQLKMDKLAIIASIPVSGTRPNDWVLNKTQLEKVILYNEKKIGSEKLLDLDSKMRHLVYEGTNAGFSVMNKNNEWIDQDVGNVQKMLQTQFPELSIKEIQGNIGNMLWNPWKLVNQPFQEEYPGIRTWNKESAQFAYDPIKGDCRTWISMLDRLGKEIDEPVLMNDWCAKNFISTGGEFLLYWIASMFQRPTLPLPYLFFWSVKQDTGKSSFHEALSMLFKNMVGVCRADNVLDNASGFNGEMFNAVLCVIEEKDFSGADKLAYGRIKDFVTSITVNIQKKYHDSFKAINTTHWVQCANNANACPIGEGGNGNSDTRIISIEVQPIEVQIPKETFMGQLKSEASAFIHLIMNEIVLPLPHSRMGLPTLITRSKKEISKSNQNLMYQFIEERCFCVYGHYVPFSQFYLKFQIYLQNKAPNKAEYWNKTRIGLNFHEFDAVFRGRHKGEEVFFNMAFEIIKPEGFLWAKENGKIVKRDVPVGTLEEDEDDDDDK